MDIEKVLENYMYAGLEAKRIGVLFFEDMPIQMNQKSLEGLIKAHNLPFKIERGMYENKEKGRLIAKYKNFDLVAVEEDK